RRCWDSTPTRCCAHCWASRKPRSKRCEVAASSRAGRKTAARGGGAMPTRCVAAALAALLVPGAALAAASDYPARPVRLVVPYPPGGGNDTLARLFGQQLAARWNEQVVVDNRPGAGTTIGAQLVARAAPDGYTLLLSSIATHALAPALYSKPGYDPIADFTPVTTLAVAPTLCVAAPSFGPKTIQELVAAAKAKPDEIRFASGGNGTTPHIAGEVFK